MKGSSSRQHKWISAVLLPECQEEEGKLDRKVWVTGRLREEVWSWKLVSSVDWSPACLIKRLYRRRYKRLVLHSRSLYFHCNFCMVVLWESAYAMFRLHQPGTSSISNWATLTAKLRLRRALNIFRGQSCRHLRRGFFRKQLQTFSVCSIEKKEARLKIFKFLVSLLSVMA